MVYALIIIIFILIIIIFIQRSKIADMTKTIKYTEVKLNKIMVNNTQERIKIFTSNKEIKELLKTINKLLDYNSENVIKYNKANISMKKMLSNISHDLKTPLTVILGYAEILQLKNIERIMVDKIYNKIKEVIDLINKFFDLAKLESGDKKIEKSKINICEICRTTILGFYDKLSNDGIETFINIPKENVFVLGNEEALVRILNNLISNSIKYGSDGKYLGLVVKEKNEVVTVNVIDKGKGIEDKHKEEVFERIFTLDDSRSKAYQGSGLGLTITKALVEKLGGEIHLNSIPYVKTVFSFTLNKFNY